MNRRKTKSRVMILIISTYEISMQFSIHNIGKQYSKVLSAFSKQIVRFIMTHSTRLKAYHRRSRVFQKANLPEMTENQNRRRVQTTWWTYEGEGAAQMTTTLNNSY